MIVVTTPTGQIGGQLVARLVERDEPVRVVVRDPSRLDARIRDAVEAVEGSHDDTEVLDRALDGADALFWLVPPNPQAPSAEEHYLRFARAGADAVRRRGVGHVVAVSSAGHEWSHPAGLLTAAFVMDAELERAGSAYRALSMPFYLENLLDQAEGMRDRGAFSLTFPSDRPMATIATRDIAETAAVLLTDRSWAGQETVPVFGPDLLTPDQMAEVISDVLGRPVAYRRQSLEDFATMMADHGASEQTIRDLAQMFAAQADGIYDADQAVAKRTATDFRTWCNDVLRAAATA